MKKLLFLLALTLAFLLARAPASLLDGLVAQVSADGLRLQQAEGSLWHGRGVLASRDPNGRSLTPWLPLGWDFERAALGRFGLAWTLSSSATPLGRIEIGPGGLGVSALSLHVPAAAALAGLPHPAARAGWQGDLSLAAPRWSCPPDGRCSGQARLLWRGAASALFPGRRFGDYELLLEGEAGRLRFTLHTLAGELHAEGRGSLAPGEPLRFDGRLSGDAEFLSRLPAIAAGAARPAGAPGQYEIHWPPR